MQQKQKVQRFLAALTDLAATYDMTFAVYTDLDGEPCIDLVRLSDGELLATELRELGDGFTADIVEFGTAQGMGQ